MATTTEEKKRVERPADLVMPPYAPPTNTATQQAQAEADAFYNELRQRYAQAADPAVQAAQDARIQRGRQFWTGANLFANVIANAINANGTANGAPNMTWNDASTQKMYETWKDADARLRADRKEAQQRYDAMGLQQQQMRLAAAQAQDRADLDAYNTQFGLDKDAAVAKYNADMDEYKTQSGWQHDDEVYEKKLADSRKDATTAFNRNAYLQQKQTDRQIELAEIRAQQAKGYNKGNKTVRIGNVDFKAETEDQADSNIWQVYGMLLDAYNNDPKHKGMGLAPTGKVDDAYAFINTRFNEYYKDGSEFAKAFDQFKKDHSRSVLQDYGGMRSAQQEASEQKKPWEDKIRRYMKGNSTGDF